MSEIQQAGEEITLLDLIASMHHEEWREWANGMLEELDFVLSDAAMHATLTRLGTYQTEAGAAAFDEIKDKFRLVRRWQELASKSYAELTEDEREESLAWAEDALEAIGSALGLDDEDLDEVEDGSDIDPSADTEEE